MLMVSVFMGLYVSSYGQYHMLLRQERKLSISDNEVDLVTH